MKYVRTKDGRIYPTNNIRKKEGCVCYDIIKGSGTLFEDKDILKQANTIEELCDEFVLYDSKDMINTFISTYERVMNWKEVLDKRKLDKSNYEIYGAIWTEWGLKYVAKMNEDGVLCLI